MRTGRRENGRAGRGIIMVVSSPSGGGKTTLCRRLLSEVPGLALSVSHTTRPPRRGEREGRDYHFISEKEFLRMERSGEFLEWANVYGRRYGTGRKMVEKLRRRGIDVLLDIDVQGALQVKKRIPQTVLVFILPPSGRELRERLQARGTETPEGLRIRLATAKKELALLSRYDYAVLNDDLNEAFQVLKSILTAERCRVSRRWDGI